LIPHVKELLIASKPRMQRVETAMMESACKVIWCVHRCYVVQGVGLRGRKGWAYVGASGEAGCRKRRACAAICSWEEVHRVAIMICMICIICKVYVRVHYQVISARAPNERT
jgi:hypothetical protein